MACFDEIIRVGEGEARLRVSLWDDLPDFQYGKKRPMILVIPGGGYHYVAEREGDPIAMSFQAMGYQTAVLTYSVMPTAWPQQLLEAAAAVKLIREKAEAWHVDPAKLATAGFSAGGSLAAELGVHWQEPWLAEAVGADCPEQLRPDLQILVYAVLGVDRYPQLATRGTVRPGDSFVGKEADAPVRYVSEHTPPTFLAHALGDALVTAEQSLYFAEALRKAGVPFSLHIYQNGPHGFALGNQVTYYDAAPGSQSQAPRPGCALWVEQAGLWLEEHFHSFEEAEA